MVSVGNARAGPAEAEATGGVVVAGGVAPEAVSFFLLSRISPAVVPPASRATASAPIPRNFTSRPLSPLGAAGSGGGGQGMLPPPCPGTPGTPLPPARPNGGVVPGAALV